MSLDEVHASSWSCLSKVLNACVALNIIRCYVLASNMSDIFRHCFDFHAPVGYLIDEIAHRQLASIMACCVLQI